MDSSDVTTDELVFTPILSDPSPRRGGKSTGNPEGPAKQLARQNPGRWVLAKLHPGRKRHGGMLSSASEWQTAVRWFDDASEFGISGPAVGTYIKFVGSHAVELVRLRDLIREWATADNEAYIAGWQDFDIDGFEMARRRLHAAYQALHEEARRA